MRTPSFQALEGLDAVENASEALGGTVFELSRDYPRLLEILHEKGARAARALHVAVDDASELGPFAAQDIPMVASGSAQEASDLSFLASLLARNIGGPVLHFFDRRWVGGEFAKVDVLTREDLDRLAGAGPVKGESGKETVREAFERLSTHFKDIAGRAYSAFEYSGPAEPDRLAATLGQDAEPDGTTGVVRVRLWRPFDGRRFLQSFPSTVRSLAAVKALQPDVLAAVHQGIVGGWSWFTALPPLTELSPVPVPPREDVLEAVVETHSLEAQNAVRQLLQDLSSRSPSYFQSYTIAGDGKTEVHLRLSLKPIRSHGPVLRPALTIRLNGSLLTASGLGLPERSIDIAELARRAGLGEVIGPILSSCLLSLVDSEKWLGLSSGRAAETVLETVQDRWGDFSGGIVEAHRRAMELARAEIWNPEFREAALPQRAAQGQAPGRPSRDPADLKADYLGFRLRSPLIACVSDAAPQPELAAAPIGAVFFGPVSEEALDREAWKTFSDLSRGEGVPGIGVRPPLERPLERLRGWKASVETPVIAGIEAASEKSWLAIAFALEQAGADALELFLKSPEEGGPADALRIIQLVAAAVRIPVAARISPGLTPLLKEGPGAMAQAGLKALVLFRPPCGLVPDLDRLEMRHEALLAGDQVFRLALPVLGALADGGIDLGAAGPVTSSGDVLGALLAGSRAVYVTADPVRLKQLEEALASWMVAKGFSGVESINATRRGS